MKRKTVANIVAGQEKLTMLTAYDFWTGQLVDRAGTDMILVGDSLGMVVQGHDNTLSVTVDDMVYHCKAVARGREQALVVGDMPYMSYHVNREETVRNAGRIIREGKADAVKLEGGRKRLPMIQAILDAEIPVMGHLGLTPQSVNAMGGFKVQGKDELAREQLREDALALQQAGVFAIVLECIPFDLAKEITEALQIPTIGIGAGPFCDGQVLVIHDMLGLGFGHKPKFVRQFAQLGESGFEAVQRYCDAVREGSFPSLKEAYRPAKTTSPITLYPGQSKPLAVAAHGG